MIRVKVQGYCQSCPNFEPEVEKITTSHDDLKLRSVVHITSTIIRCTQRDQCEHIKQYLINGGKEI